MNGLEAIFVHQRILLVISSESSQDYENNVPHVFWKNMFHHIQWHAKVLNTLQIVEFFKYYTVDDCQTWSEYSNITGFFTDNRLMNKKYYLFLNSEIFKITLCKSFGHIQFFIDFFVISLWYCIKVALILCR